MLSQIEVYRYVSTQLSRGKSQFAVREQALDKFGPVIEPGIDLMLVAYFASVAAGSLLTNSEPGFTLTDADLPSVPGEEDSVVYIMKVYHNPGEYIWVIKRSTGRSLSLQELLPVASQALRQWQSSGQESPVLPGEGVIAFRGGLADVPKGFFKVSVERAQRELQNMRFF